MSTDSLILEVFDDMEDDVEDLTEHIVIALRNEFPVDTGTAVSSFGYKQVNDNTYEITAVDYVEHVSWKGSKNSSALEDIVDDAYTDWEPKKS